MLDTFSFFCNPPTIIHFQKFFVIPMETLYSAMNKDIQYTVWIPSFYYFGYIPKVEKLDHMVILFNFLEPPYFFYSGYTILLSYQ